MLDPDAPPHHPAIAAALGPVRAALRVGLAGAGGAGSAGGAARRLLVACSGGADSVAALGLVAILRRSEGLEIHVGHVDHGLRPESGREAEHVAELAAGLGLDVRSTRLELAPGPGIPARARAARRAALEAQREAVGASAVILAHTSTDQAETMLMHLTRGAGLEGLAAMRSFERPWLRPLLDLSRAQTRALCAHLGLAFVDDPTNADTEALRIWLREGVLPGLRAQNPRVEAAMLGLARQAGEAEDALRAWAAVEVDRRRQAGDQAGDQTGGTASLAGFGDLPRAVRTRVLRQLCAEAGVDLSHLGRHVLESMDSAAVEVARAQAGGRGSPRPSPRTFDLHPRRRVQIDKHGFWAGLAPNKADPPGL